MNFRANRAASACLLLLAALLMAAMPTASSQIPMRGFQGNLDNTADTFLSLDLNGDGKADMLYYRPGGGYAGAYLSHGDGTFRYVTYVNGGTGYNGFPGDLSSPQDAFVALDLNGDGKSDFIEYRPGSGFTILCLSKGDGTVNCSNLSDPNGTYRGFQDNMRNGNERIVALDLNHDGRSDFIVYTPGGGSANAYLSNGDGTVQRIVLTTNGSPNTQVGFRENMNAAHVRIVPIDLNGDGYADLLVYAPESGVVRTYLNSRSNTFVDTDLSIGGSQQNGFTGNSQNLNAHAIALDLNGDGKQDFLWWQAGSSTVIGFLSNGNGTVTPVNYLTNGTTANGFADTDGSPGDNAVALDLNGDGKSDFIWYSPGNNAVTGYTSSSSGALTAQTYRTPSNRSYGFQNSPSTQYDTALPLNFLGQAASGFVWYVPGSKTFQAYTPYLDTQVKLNYYNFYTQPATYLSDLNWSIGNVPLKEVVMLGTHDSSMFGLNPGIIQQYETTQFADFPGQLTAGARVFDFRTDYMLQCGSGCYEALDGSKFTLSTSDPGASGYYMTGHGNTVTDRSVLDVINEIEYWLIQNPNEVAILEFSAAVSGSLGDFTQPVVYALSHSLYPQLIYSPQAACGANSCPPQVQPQNKTINQLIAKGSRLILVNGPDATSSISWGTVMQASGYCGDGRGLDQNEDYCIDYGDPSESPMSYIRPPYVAADAAANFFKLSAVLTEGLTGEYEPVIAPPTELAIGGGLIGQGYNNGNTPYDLPQYLPHWGPNPQNFFYLDALRYDPIEQQVISLNNQTWVNTNFFNNNLPNAAAALSVGVNGDVWAAGSGHSIAIFKYVNGAWKDMINSQPNVKKLAVDPQGGVWVVDGSQGRSSLFGSLIHYDANGQNKNVTGSVVQDVAVGRNGSVWAMGLDGSIFEAYGPTDGSPDIKSSVPTQYGSHVAVDNMGHPWVVDNNGYVQKFNGSGWQQVSGDQGKEIVAGADGSIFITGYNTPSIGRYNVQNNSFDFLHMDAAHIAVDGGGQPWAIRQITGAVYKGSLDQM